jgi:glycolate oxidase FAD binding subunit
MKGMHPVTPRSAEDMALALREAAAKGRTVGAFGNNSKRLMAGPLLPADITISTAGLCRVLQYEPNDLTISVEAGMPFAELQTLLARHGQMIALDPPFSAQATAGGVVASNSSGPMRRCFGTARDLVIGMKFATLDGSIVSTGGMVVKNVAGLDMGKIMIGSFGTLAVMTSLNFRLHPLPEETHTFLFSFPGLEAVIEKRNAILQSVLRPMAMDIISPPAAARLGARGYVLAIRVSGSPSVLARYARELSGGELRVGPDDVKWWAQIQEFPGDFLRRQRNGVVLRISTKLSDTGALLRLISGASISRAASGVTYVYLTSWQAVQALWRAARENRWSAVVEFAPEENRTPPANDLWLLGESTRSRDSFAIMKKVKHMFDPNNLLNRSRLHGRI